jgi:hypothetical protein
MWKWSYQMLISNDFLRLSMDTKHHFVWSSRHLKISALSFSISTSKIHLAEVPSLNRTLHELVHVIPGPNKQRACNNFWFWAELGDTTICPVASFVLWIHFTNKSCVICGARLARSIIENTCWEGLDRISDKLLTRGLKEDVRPFYLWKLDLIGHRWFKVMAVNLNMIIRYEHSEQARAPHTNGPRDVPRCGALSLLQKTLHYKGGW